MSELDDAELLSAYVSRQSEEAFSMLVERYIALVYSAALRQVQNPDQAKEVTQAVFIVLAQKAGKLSETKVLAGWLCRTAHFVARNARRTEYRRLHREQEAYMQSLLNESDTKAWAQMSPLLDEAVAQLNELDRNAVVLRFYQQKPLHEVGNILGVDPDTAQKRVSRALDKLRRFFSKRGVVSTTAIIAGAISGNSVQAAPIGLAGTVTATAVHGAAVSSSTVTLVRGAIKLMVWAKMKTVLVLGTAAILTVGTTSVLLKASHDEVSDAAWNDDPKAIEALPPLVILRPTKFPQSRAGGIMLPESGKMAIRCEPMEVLLTHAYNWSPVRTIYNAPLADTRFDYLVTLPEKQEEALQKKIREQLGIIGHRETRDVPVYVVKSAGSSKIPSSTAGEQVIENGHYHGPVSSMWYSLENYLQRPLIAETDSQPDHDVDLRWDDQSKEPISVKGPQVDALRQALRSQLGLDLVSTNRSIEMLVLEKVK